ncbi:oxidoreductase [Amylibacter kogurei]|uniref:Oxidoreductase n=1 Tax=Paramylibacter kogurei TaxID=1889778 RepID=A0A2G5K7F1_9RHOB|nr:FAD-binding oxidoreductase [Amylibacter kogurei]PIB25049.1 oxidoreductase [Amylibacter kogurei]
MDLLTANDVAGEYPASYYAATAKPLPIFPPAKGGIDADICIIGAGFTGLSSALHLARAGYHVVVLDAQRIGFGASGRNGGQVGKGQRLEQDELETMLGCEHARALWDISQDAVQLVKDLCADMPDCAFQHGLIHAAHRERYVGHEHVYVDKMAAEYDYPHMQKLDRAALRDLVNSDAYFGGSLDMNAGHIHPLRFALGMARKCVDAEVQFFEQSRVVRIEHGARATVHTGDAKVSADFVIVACNGYLGNLEPQVARHVMPIGNYIVATEPMDTAQMNAVVKNHYAVADTKFVVNYFRFSDDNRLLFGGTESYGYKFPRDIAGKVRKPMAAIFPQLADIKIDYAWGGTLGITMNRMPHFYRAAGNIISLSGYSGHGVAMATMGGKLAAEVVQGQAERFDIMANVPSQKFPGGVALRHPLLIAAMLWYSLRDKL